MPKSRFKRNDLVRRRSQPEAVGRILSGYSDEVTGQWIYTVQFGNATRGIADTELEALPDVANAWDDMRNGIYGDAEAFRTLMTFERLRRPPSPIAASFGSAKAAFYPFQFKPLLKFLENPKKRLLIADDVGLGKTIEAGYIVRELKTQVNIERVLLVVPSRLRSKWRDEMKRRFDEHFDIVSGQQIAELRNKMEMNQVLDRFYWIVSLESARSKKVIEFLEDLQPSIDIVVVDEAHRMRNTGTLQHQLGKALSTCAEHMIMLTATPVQTSLDNLFRLLNILDDSEFSDAQLFSGRCEANRAIVRAATAMRIKPPDVTVALEALNGAKSNPYTQPLTESNFYASLMERCRKAESLSRESLVELQRDINELSLTGQIISRTRKAEVITDRPLREAKTVRIRFTEAEQAFYEKVEQLCQIMRPDLSSWGQTLAVLQWFRATASCIPAAARRFREKLSSRPSRNEEGMAREFDEGGEVSFSSSATIQNSTEHLHAALKENTATIDLLATQDSKYKLLVETLREIWKEEPHADSLRKIVLFAYFKPTLAYLDERLNRDGIRTRLITGDISIPEREARIEEFSVDTNIPVLLSSEVGSEGLDLQFASVVVNYDLPWNPMVVEQRIGRVDRIGQSAEKILIVNMVASETIEERILLRLYDRIGVFEDTIGEIDPILGDTVEKLASEAVQGKLTPDQQRKRAEESANAMVNRRNEAESLSEKTDTLLAADQSFLDEIDELVGRRRIPSEAELYAYVKGFLVSRFDGFRFPESLVHRVGEIHAPSEIVRMIMAGSKSDSQAVQFGRKLENGAVKATFNQEAALKNANAELVHSRHPLVRMVTKERRRNDKSWPRSFALRLAQEGLIGEAKGLSGDFAFEIYIFDTGGVRPRVTLVPIVMDGNHGLLGDAKAEDLFLSLLQHSKKLDPSPELPAGLTDRLQGDLHKHLNLTRSKVAESVRSLNEIQSERLRATLAVALDHRVSVAKRRVDEFKNKGFAEFATRMARARLERAEHERSARLGEIAQATAPELETELVAAGVLLIDCNSS